MKSLNRYLFVFNLFLIVGLFLLADPFVFFPKVYEDSPLFIRTQIDRIHKVALEFSDRNKVTKYSFVLEDKIWMLSDSEKDEKKIAEATSVAELLAKLKTYRKFEKTKKTIPENEFWGEIKISILLDEATGESINLEFGKCLHSESDCYVREFGSEDTYLIPNSIYTILTDLNPNRFLSKSPFQGIPLDSIVKISYLGADEHKYTIYKEKDVWKTDPVISGEIDEKRINELLIRVQSWKGDEVYTAISKEEKISSLKVIQRLTLEYQIENGEFKIISLKDLGYFSKNRKLIEVSPYSQYILFSAYNWDYWKFFDVRQLLKIVE